MIRNTKSLKFLKKVITLPSGYAGFTEEGNIYNHNGLLIWTNTCIKIDSTVKWGREYSTHYWTSTNPEVWNYGGKLNLTFESEDATISHYDNRFHIFYENKSEEKNYGQYKISHEFANNLNDKWSFLGGSAGYSIKETGLEGAKAVYSPLIIDKNTLLADVRFIDCTPHTENIGLTKWLGSKWSNLKLIMEAKDYGYDTMGNRSSVHKVDNMYVMEVGGLLDWKKPTQRWTQGLAECSTMTGKWEFIVKELKHNGNQITYAGFFKTDKWYALACEACSSDYYLATIVTGGSEPPINGDNMIPIIKLEDNKLSVVNPISGTKYSWNYGKTTGGYDGWLGFGDTFDIPVSKQEDGYEFWCYPMSDASKISKRIIYKSGTVEPPITEPNDNAEIVAQIKVLLDKII